MIEKAVEVVEEEIIEIPVIHWEDEIVEQILEKPVYIDKIKEIEQIVEKVIEEGEM